MIRRIAWTAIVALAMTSSARAQSNYEDQIANLKLIIADKDQKIAALDQQLTLTRQNGDLLDQINAQNFDKMQVAWRFSTANLGPRVDH